jgi:hypothetical protein
MTVPQRHADGRLLPGQASLNPGGRPRTAIEELRARLLPRLPEFMDGLIELTKSPNEATRLSAIKEILDRLLGKPAVFVDAVGPDLCGATADGRRACRIMLVPRWR